MLIVGVSGKAHQGGGRASQGDGKKSPKKGNAGKEPPEQPLMMWERVKLKASVLHVSCCWMSSQKSTELQC
eukprot:4695342-Amphidinium_carterae.1